MMKASDNASLGGPKNPALWAYAQSHVQTHASSHAQLSVHASNVANFQPHYPIPFVFYHHQNIISNDLAASLPSSADNVLESQCPYDTSPTSLSEPAHADLFSQQNVYLWEGSTYSSESQGLGHFKHPRPRSPESWMTVFPEGLAGPSNQPLGMDISAITTRPQPTRLWSESTGSLPSATSPRQKDGLLDKYSDMNAEGTPAEHGNKRKRQLESNRKAARKCRQKVKNQEKDLETREKEVQQLNSRLHAQASALKEEVLGLKNEILAHSACDCALINQYISSTAFEM